MNTYEEKVLREAEHWKFSMLKRPSKFQRTAKALQLKLNEKIPAKVHRIITESIKKWLKPRLLGPISRLKKRCQRSFV